ncbi:hypothetical protein [Pseudoclavibacter sp. 13-3]|uniref:hypothetical protein n=1 Tax=Pseudoclavibacter sp. 13-3 TaxID=2901228 RepID=UPI001E2FFAFD|nr:hypothetical protein [Pseudoclavibacter sp. 13-3]MCD7101952.1 hypothetical protein [Pseudoclavibacter sp. 13-3]
MSVTAAWIGQQRGVAPEHMRVEIAPGVTVPRFAYIDVADEPGIPLTINLSVVLDGDTYRVDLMKIRRTAPGDDVNLVALRSVRVHEFVQRGLSDIAHDANGNPFSPLAPLDEDVLSGYRAEPGGAATLQAVAMTYRMATLLSMRPAKAVRERFRLTEATATVWIRRARDRGILEPAGRKVEPLPLHTFEFVQRDVFEDQDV